jgi:rare lipoprotein A (RlpA)-like double-psi beta-barrel protein
VIGKFCILETMFSFLAAGIAVAPTSVTILKHGLSRSLLAAATIAFALTLGGCGDMGFTTARRGYLHHHRYAHYVGQGYIRSPGVVTASWYGPGFSGRRTSSGERFDPNQLTAASPTLPLGSVVHVTNVSNGRSVNVRINDRGPFVRGRSLDLSHRAAQKIGLTAKGIGRVKVTRVRHPEFSTATASAI